MNKPFLTTFQKDIVARLRQMNAVVIRKDSPALADCMVVKNAGYATVVELPNGSFKFIVVK